jgi:DNA-binding CsgD family transcriptional regulator
VPKPSEEVRRRTIVLATRKCTIQFADSTARRWLKQFFGRPVRAEVLPRKVCRWMSQHAQTRAGSSLLTKKKNARLYLKKQKSYTPEITFLLLELIKGKPAYSSRRHRDLTPRECEVLFWLARGKSNAEIATILGIQSATVGKHLERIYPKLGVENRTAAVSLASESNASREANDYGARAADRV